MIDALVDALIDSLKLFPFLFITFLIMEYFEHKMTSKNKKIIEKSGKYGPLLGSVLGIFPQCGFSVMATNLYATRVITVGTLISVYLATSDEMLPILISERVELSFIITVLLIKVVVGMIFGFLIDFIFRKQKSRKESIHHMCEDEHCGCDHGIIKPTLKHTFNILVFIFFMTFILNLGFSYLGEEKISKLFMKNSIFGPFLSSLIGLIPNCSSSILITELYLNHTISFASLISGLLTGSGVALLVLFRSNKNIKENVLILTTIYLIGVFIGLLCQVTSLF
jgi:hypothetical protein